MTYSCGSCGWEYDESASSLGPGVPSGVLVPGTKWSEIDDAFVCPLCGAGKDMFS